MADTILYDPDEHRALQEKIADVVDKIARNLDRIDSLYADRIRILGQVDDADLDNWNSVHTTPVIRAGQDKLEQHRHELADIKDTLNQIMSDVKTGLGEKDANGTAAVNRK